MDITKSFLEYLQSFTADKDSVAFGLKMTARSGKQEKRVNGNLLSGGAITMQIKDFFKDFKEEQCLQFKQRENSVNFEVQKLSYYLKIK